MKLAILALLSAYAAGEADPSFSEFALPAGRDPETLAAADINHDGRPDLIVANLEAETVTVLLNDGHGRFHAAAGSPFACGHEPNDFAIADFNRDGNLDLAIVNTQSPFITVLLGDGKGAFRPAAGSPIRTESYPHPHGVAAGDFNGDGKLDLMTDSWGHNQIELLVGDGKGGFTLGPFFPVGKRPYQRLRSADINGDGRADIVTTNLDGDNVTILLGDGKGGFQEANGSPVKVGAAPWAVAIADLNGDGKLDLATIPYDRDAKTRGGSAAATVLLGDGAGGFREMAGSPFPLTGCAQPTQLATGDLSGGRIRDIAVTCVNSGSLALLFANGNSGYRLVTRPMGGKPNGIAIADFDGDGKADIAVSNSAGDSVTLLLRR
jgi:hypothetical protein